MRARQPPCQTVTIRSKEKSAPSPSQKGNQIHVSNASTVRRISSR